MILPHKSILARLVAEREGAAIRSSGRVYLHMTAEFVGSLVYFAASIDTADEGSPGRS
jgi:hypothetical protein